MAVALSQLHIGAVAMLRSSGSSCGRLLRSKSVDALEARRRHLADEVRSLQQANHLEPSGSYAAAAQASRFENAPRVSEAGLRRVELWAQLVAEHSELVARAMDLDRVTADAISESQALSEASRLARWQKHGLGAPDACFPALERLSAPAAWDRPPSNRHRALPATAVARPRAAASAPLYTNSLAGHSTSLVSALMSPRETQSRFGSGLDHSRSTLDASMGASFATGAGHEPQTIVATVATAFDDVPRTFVQRPSRSTATASPSRSWAGGTRTIDNPWIAQTSQEPPRPAIYSTESPRRRHRSIEDSKLLEPPFRPVLPSRAEASYAAESPRSHSPYRQTHNLDASMASLSGGGIAEIRARRERLAREVSKLGTDSVATSLRRPLVY